MNIQWYPGHMTKAKRAMKEDIKLIDLIIELVDARAPLASRNPDLDELGKGKARLILLNKADLAGEKENGIWMDWFRTKGFYVAEVNSQRGDGIKKINGIVLEACKEKLERDRRRGILNRPVRAMVVGIPNVGKSTFINSFAGKACTRTGNKPGVTKGNQWIRLNKSLELLDTPGILWPKFEDPRVGLLLAMIGSVNDEILDRDGLAAELVKLLQERQPEILSKRYSGDEGAAWKEEKLAGEEPEEVEEDEAVRNRREEGEAVCRDRRVEDETVCRDRRVEDEAVCRNRREEGEAVCWDRPEEVLCQIARVRACLKKGGELDLSKAAGILIEDFRGGRLGRITLELPKQ